jgi:hypothetical protein
MIHPTIMQNLNPKFLLFCAKKMTKSNMFWRFENDYSYIQFCHFLSFLCSSEYKVFEIDFLHVCGIHHWLYADLFSEFFETQKYVFDFLNEISGVYLHQISVAILFVCLSLLFSPLKKGSTISYPSSAGPSQARHSRILVGSAWSLPSLGTLTSDFSLMFGRTKCQ